MNAGKLRHRVKIRNLIETQSTVTGALVQSWSTVIDGMWASIEPLQGREYFASQQMQSRVSHKIIMRYTTIAIDPKMVAVNGTRIYEIESVINPEMRNDQLQLMCFERIGT